MSGLAVAGLAAALLASAPPDVLQRAQKHWNAAHTLEAQGRTAEAVAQARAAYKALAPHARVEPVAPEVRTLLCQALELLDRSKAELDEAAREQLAKCAAPLAPALPPAAPAQPAATLARPEPQVVVLFPNLPAAARRELLLGHWAEGIRVLDSEEWVKRGGNVTGSMDRARKLETAASQVDTAPDEALELLREVIASVDEAAAADLKRLREIVFAGKPREAMIAAVALSERLEAPVAAMVLQLPPRLLAVLRHQQAQERLDRGDGVGALGLLEEANALAAPYAERRGLLEKVRRLRAEHFQKKATEAIDAGRAAQGYAYLVAAGALGASGPDYAAALARARPAERARIAYRLALRDSSDRRWTRAAALQEGLRASLRSHLADHVALVNAGEQAEREIAGALQGPDRVASARVEARKKTLKAYTARKPNPAWRAAARAYNDTVHELDLAISDYRNALDPEKAMDAIRSASAAVKKAKAQLAQLPEASNEDIQAEVEYPVVALEVKATARYAFRVSGFGQSPLERDATFSSQAIGEHVLGAPELQIENRPVAVERLAEFLPDPAQAASEIAVKMVAAIRTADELRLWSAARGALSSGSVEAATLAQVDYLEGAGLDPKRRKQALDFLVRELP